MHPTARRFPVLLLAVLALLTLSGTGRCQETGLDKSPTLRIETGMHIAQVSGIAADPAGRWLATGSTDKTVRVWDAADGRLLQTLRPPLGAGDEGKIDAVAVAPDGATIACGGFTSAPGQGGGVCVYLFDRASGRIRGRIVGLANVVLALAYSPDGRFLAAGLGRHGVQVFRTADGTAEAQDTQYADSCYGVDFDRAGRLVTAALDGYIRLYDARFQRVARTPAPAGRNPYSAAFSPDGTRIAVGYYDTTRVSVLSSKDLSLDYAPDTAGVTNGNLTRVAWSRDGQTLYAAGKYQQASRFLIRRWADGGRGTFRDLVPGARNSIAALAPVGADTLAWSGTAPGWGVLDGAKPRLTVLSRASDFAGIGAAFRLSPDGGVVQFRDAGHAGALTRFSLSARLLAPGAADDPTTAPPATQAPGVDITGWDNTPTPRLNGKPLALTGHEASRSRAFAPGGGRFLLGTTEQVRCYDRAGTLLWHVPAPELTWAVNVAGNGRVAAAAFGDGTVRWYRMSDGAELLALFPDADRARWLCWTPQGRYDCSPGGEDFVGWHINRGAALAADFFPSSRFRADYYRPRLVGAVLGPLAATPSAPPALSPVLTAPPPLPPIAQILPPVVRILSPEDGTAFGAARVTLRYTVRTPSGDPATAVHVLIDGRPASEQRDLRLVSAGSGEGGERQIAVLLPGRDCTVTLIAENKHTASAPALIRLKWGGTPAPDAFVIKPKLYVLAVGISAYQDPSLKLAYGAADARDFARTLLAQKGTLYRDVQERVLTDGGATKDDILDGLQWIREQTTSKDVAMIFLAGHGANDPDTGSYLFIPQNFDRTRQLRTGLPYTDIKSTVQSVAGKALFFIDTCHAGNVMGVGRARGASDVTSVINELSSAENGVVVFSASTGSQVSYEDAAWGHGAFTKALVEGLTGGADYQHTGRITVNMLDLFLSERVKTLTHGRQTPTTTKPETVPDFPVAVLK